MDRYASDDIRAIVADPRESFDVELKAWIDPQTSEGRAVIAKACLALRNNNGGLLLIGFNNDGSVSQTDVLEHCRKTYHIDTIQGIVSKYASEPFGISLEFIEREGQTHPVVVVPTGVQTPVACKSDLPGDGLLLKCDTVYVRTLLSNNVISSSPARYRDWPRVAGICFDNREADIGAFVRRHLAGPKLTEAIAALAGIDFAEVGKPAELSVLDRGKARFDVALAKRGIDSIEGCGTLELGVCADGVGGNIELTQSNLFGIGASMPSISGWPPWVVLLNAGDTNFHPYVMDNGWQALLVGGVLGAHIDFWRIEPKGELYHVRVLEDDLTESPNRPERGTGLDYHLQIIRVAEFVAVGVHIVRALGFAPDDTTLNVACRWTKLAGRRLCSWADRSYWPLRTSGVAMQDEIATFAKVPLNTPNSALGQYVSALVSPVFALFGGFSMEIEGFDQTIEKFFTRRGY